MIYRAKIQRTPNEFERTLRHTLPECHAVNLGRQDGIASACRAAELRAAEMGPDWRVLDVWAVTD